MAAIPGVESVALSTSWPLQALRPQAVEVDAPGGRSTIRVSVAAVSPAYFETMGVQMASGRAFEPFDRVGTEPVAIVSDALARRISPDGRALGARVGVPEDDNTARQERMVVRQVVGIARNVRQTPGDDDLADLYVPLPQVPGRFAMMYVRTSGAPAGWLPQLRAAFKEIDPEIPLNSARPLQAAFDEQVARPAFLAWLLAGFAIVAAMLALVGVYGVIAYAVRQREREIAVRIAIGAEPRAITALFVKQGSVVLLAGLRARRGRGHRRRAHARKPAVRRPPGRSAVALRHGRRIRAGRIPRALVAGASRRRHRSRDGIERRINEQGEGGLAGVCRPRPCDSWHLLVGDTRTGGPASPGPLQRSTVC